MVEDGDGRSGEKMGGPTMPIAVEQRSMEETDDACVLTTWDVDLRFFVSES